MTDEYTINPTLIESITNVTSILSNASNSNSASEQLNLIPHPTTETITRVPQFLMDNLSAILDANNGTLSQQIFDIDPNTGLTGGRGIFCIGGEFANGANYLATFSTPNGLVPCYVTDFVPIECPLSPTLTTANPYAIQIYQPPVAPLYQPPVAPPSGWIESIPSFSEIVGYGSSCWQSFSTTISEHCAKLPNMPSISDLTEKLPSMPTLSGVKDSLPNMPSTTDLTAHLPTIPSTTDMTSALGTFLTAHQDTLIATGVITGAAIATVGTVVGGIYCLRKIDENQRAAEQRRAQRKQETKEKREYAKKNPDTPEGQAYLKKQSLLGILHEFSTRHPRHDISQAYERVYPKTKARLDKNDSDRYAQLKRKELLESIHEFADLNPKSKITKAYYKAFPKTSNRLGNRA
ncbi:MAG: hypothetical protein U1E78_06810 [Gammaproteobacteria bacterium]